MTILRYAVLAIQLCGPAAAQTPGPSEGETLTLAFAPPEIAAEPICLARAPDAELVATWGAWDGKTLPDRPTGLITRDLRRLAELDPVKWDSTIQAAIRALAQTDPKFSADDAKLAQINQMIATGQLSDLAESGLVQDLLHHGDQTSSRLQFELSGLLTEGVGIEKDPAKGTELLIAAGYGGNADALLALSKLSLAGQAPPGWDIPPDLSVTMAFGALVGQMDPLICDRIARIAREYTSGAIVTVDDALAHRWYRFAADLGDPISAWRVVEYHMRSELVSKDNDLLMTYLNKAAEGGLPYAMVTLGRILEVGALVPQDIEAARSLYEKAAQTGDYGGLVRLAGFLEERLDTEPDLRPAFLDTLQRLTELPEAPGWAFTKRAMLTFEDEGRWQGEAAALPLLQKAAERQDSAAIRALAQINLGRARTEAEFYAAVDPLIQLISGLGEIAPATDVKEAFLCKSPKAPQLREAAYWAGVETAIGVSAQDLGPSALNGLSSAPDPKAMAVLQAQALSGRATSVANLLAVVQSRDAPAAAFWESYAARFADVTTASAALALSRARTPAQRDAALALFADAIERGEAGAAQKLAEALLQEPNLTNRTQALALLEPLAAAGHGDAMALLQIADPARFPSLDKVYETYAEAIAANGDFSALLLALPFLTDPAQRDVYSARAMTVMSCSFPEAIAFAEVWGALDQTGKASRWLDIAAELVGQDDWQMVVLGDTQREILGADGLASAVALYEKSTALGSKTAVQRLLKLYGVRGEPGYDAERAADLYVTLIARSDPTAIPKLLADLTRQNPALAVTLDTRLDLDGLYRQAAEAGSPVAMREHARRLREAAKSPAEMEAATGWLIRASEAGDAKAMVLLSQAYALGVGIPPSIELAQEWLQRAADLGEPSALDLVKLLNTQGASN